MKPSLPHERKERLARLLAREPLGIAFNEHTDENGVTVFRHAWSESRAGSVMAVDN
jgi:hypothetical protein